MSRHLRMYFYIFTTRNVRVQICRNTKTKTIIPIIIFLHGNNYWNNVRCEIMSTKRERLAETAPSCGTLRKKSASRELQWVSPRSSSEGPTRQICAKFCGDCNQTMSWCPATDDRGATRHFPKSAPGLQIPLVIQIRIKYGIDVLF